MFDILAESAEGWSSKVVGEVNSNEIKARVMVGVEADFHINESSDELFFVLNGELELDIGEETISLSKGESFTVKSGQKHRARSKGRTEIMTIISNDA